MILVCDGYDGGSSALTRGVAAFAPNQQLIDPVDHEWIPPAPLNAVFRAGSLPQLSLLATDNGNIAPVGWMWKVTFANVPGSPADFSFYLPYSGGATRYLSQLAPVSAAAPIPINSLDGGSAVTGLLPVSSVDGGSASG